MRAQEQQAPVGATRVRFDDATMWVDLTDGRTLGVPLALFPRLLDATPAQRAAVEISPFGLHWQALDEDISIASLLAGRGDQKVVTLPYRGHAEHPEERQKSLLCEHGHHSD